MKNLGDIFKHTNEKLLEGSLGDVAEIIEFLEECQQKININDPLEAKRTVSFADGELILPSDYLKFKKLKIDGKYVEPLEEWAGVLTLPSDYVDGTAEFYFYRKPAALDPLNLDQVPDIDPRYFPSMAAYAAKMFNLVDDDEDLREAFKAEFFDGLATFKKSKTSTTTFKNVW